MAGWKSLGALLAAPAPRTLSILGFHNLAPTFSQPFVEPRFPERFRRLILRLNGRFEFVTVTEGFRRLSGGEAPSRPLIAVIFDDGYRDVLETVLPILQPLGVPATSYVVERSLRTGAIPWYEELGRVVFATPRDRVCVRVDDVAWEVDLPAAARSREPAFWDLVRRLKADFRPGTAEAVATLAETHDVAPHDPEKEPLMLRVPDIQPLLDGGFEVGSHSLTHPILPRLEAGPMREEIVDSRVRIGELIGREVTSFCYPNGDNDDRCRKLVEEAEYVCAVSMACGANAPGNWDGLRLRRTPLSENIGRLWPLHSVYRIRATLSELSS